MAVEWKSWAARPPRAVLAAVAAAAVIALGTWAAMAYFAGGSQSELRTAEATRGDLEITIAASGAIQPYEEVDVGAQVSGQLEVVHVEVGDRVKKGDLLAEIDATLLEARVESARASLDGLRAQLAEQEAEAVYARQQHQRNVRLLKGDAISQDTVQSSEAALKVAEARIEGLKADIRQAESSLGEDEANLNYTRIYAPIDGTVVSEEAVEGQTLNANQTTPTVLRIADLETMTVWAEVSEADVMRLTPGMPVYFKTLGSGGREWHSTLRQIRPEPEVVNDVVLYKALIDIKNEDRTLMPDMTAQVFFVEGQAKDAVLVPLAALQSARGARNGGDGASAQVTVLKGSRQETRDVRVGLRSRTQAEILSGVEAGETVVLPGLAARAEAAGEGRQRMPRL